jgi:peptide/nickel transport system substrate-binding protein
MKEFTESQIHIFKERVSRREFIIKTAAMGGAVASTPALFYSNAYAAGQPKKGGRLRMGIGGAHTSDSLDPALIPDVMPTCLNLSVRNCLVEIDADNKPIPELAESWEASSKMDIWNFKLRKDIVFHNGKTLDSKDVVDSINHHRGADSKSVIKGLVKQISDVKTDGKNIVTFYLSSGNADFPFILSDYHLTIQPAGTTGPEFEKGIGTGGYILLNHEPGVGALARRNPNYWKKDRAFFDEVEFIAINDQNARTSALKTGTIDVMNRCGPKTIHLLKKTPGINVLQLSSTKHYTFPVRCDLKPYNDVNVRLALKHAVDREEMVSHILKGAGRVGNDHPIAPFQRFFNTELPQHHYDPDKAKYYLKKAGMQDHVFKLHSSDGAFDGAVDAAVLYKESAKQAGISMDVVQESGDGYWTNVWQKKPWCACYWTGRPTEDSVFSLSYAAGSSWNSSLWENDRFNKLLKEARVELNENKRREMYFECQKIVHDDGGEIIPMFADLLNGATTKLAHGKKVASNWEMDGGRLAERWWFS